MPAQASAASEDAVVRQYIPLAHKVVRQYAKGAHGAQYEDAVAAATFGVLLAARSYDPSKGATFLTHARNHAKWQVCRFLYESHPMMTRGQAVKARKSLETMPPVPVSLERVPQFADRVPDNDVEPADEAAATTELSVRLRAAMAELPTKMREVCRMYVEEEISQADIARRLDLSKQRIEQILKAAIEELRGAMGVTQLVRGSVPARIKLQRSPRSDAGKPRTCCVCGDVGHNARRHAKETPGRRVPADDDTHAIVRRLIAKRSAERKARRMAATR